MSSKNRGTDLNSCHPFEVEIGGRGQLASVSPGLGCFAGSIGLQRAIVGSGQGNSHFLHPLTSVVPIMDHLLGERLFRLVVFIFAKRRGRRKGLAGCAHRSRRRRPAEDGGGGCAGGSCCNATCAANTSIGGRSQRFNLVLSVLILLAATTSIFLRQCDVETNDWIEFVESHRDGRQACRTRLQRCSR